MGLATEWQKWMESLRAARPRDYFWFLGAFVGSAFQAAAGLLPGVPGREEIRRFELRLIL
jgi:hypothetical protein